MVLGGRLSPSFGVVHRRKHSSQDLREESILSGPLRTLELAFKEAEARKAEAYRRGGLPDHATIIEHGSLRILLSGTPNPDNLRGYAKKLAQHNVKHVVRVCEPTYDASQLQRYGLCVHELPFSDGEAPTEEVLSAWLALLNHVFELKRHAPSVSRSSLMSDISSDSDGSTSAIPTPPVETVAIHCAAGLGRAPVLAAVALVELGVDPFDAVGWIRALRRGAINATQMAFVEAHSRRLHEENERQKTSRPRSGSFVGSLWPTWKAVRAFRSRSSSQSASTGSTPPSSRRNSSSSNRRTSEY